MNSENQGLQICVDDFIKQKINPKFFPVVALLRDIMKRNAPEAKEVMAYGIDEAVLVYYIKQAIKFDDQ